MIMHGLIIANGLACLARLAIYMCRTTIIQLCMKVLQFVRYTY